LVGELELAKLTFVGFVFISPEGKKPLRLYTPLWGACAPLRDERGTAVNYLIFRVGEINFSTFYEAINIDALIDALL